PAAAQNDVAKLRRGRERLAKLIFLGPARENLLDSKQPIANDVHLAIAAVGYVVALGENRFAMLMRYIGELGGALNDTHMVAAGSLVRLDDERSRVEQR